jgi:hypothetical protein
MGTFPAVSCLSPAEQDHNARRCWVSGRGASARYATHTQNIENVAKESSRSVARPADCGKVVNSS